MRTCIVFFIYVLLAFPAQTEANGGDVIDTNVCPAGQYAKCNDLPWGTNPRRTCDMYRVDYDYWSYNEYCTQYTGACWACCGCANRCTTHPHNPSECRICPGGTYKAVAGNQACTPCPPGTWANEGSTFCAPCLVGTYSLGGSVFCTQCPEGLGTCGTGRSSCDATCTTCPADTYSEFAGKGCGPCADSSQARTCKACPDGLKSLAGSLGCSPSAQDPFCPVGKYRLQCQAISFISQAGYYCSAYASSRWDKCAAEGACWACCACGGSPGCGIARLGECGDCAAGTYQDVPNSFQNCKTCQEGKWSGIGATACTDCAVGTYSKGWASTCTTCAPGTSTCGTGTPYDWTERPSCKIACTPCEAGKFSATGTSCGPCASGGTTCAFCGPGKYSLAGATACQSCAPGTTTCSAGMSACGLGCNNAGFVGPDASCTCAACAPGKYKTTRGTMACTSCPANTYHRPEPLASILATRPAFLSTSADAYDAPNSRLTDLSGNGRHGVVRNNPGSSTPFVVQGGVTGNGGGRSIPAVGSVDWDVVWTETRVPATFTICSITRFPTADGPNAYILKGHTHWYHGHDRGIAGCTYYDLGSQKKCANLQSNTEWVVACGRNTKNAGNVSTIVNLMTTSTAGGGNGDQMLHINSGLGELWWYGDWQLSRLYVWEGHLSDADFADASAKLYDYVGNTGYPETTAAQCLACPPSTPISPVGSSSPAACQRFCPPGQTGALDGVAACTACPLGKYKDTSGSAACALCPSGKYTSVTGRSICTKCDAAETMTSLIKPAGWFFHYGGDSNPIGYYSAAGKLLDPNKDYTTEGSTTSEDCVCAKGSYSKPDPQYGYAKIWGGPCTLCPAGKYREKFAADWTRFEDLGCYDCPVMTFSYEGSTTCERCDKYSWNAGTCGAGNGYGGCRQLQQCPAGYTGPDSYCNSCSACAPGTWKTVTGSAACSACAAGKSSPAGATSSVACATCAAGTYSIAGGVCTECPSWASSPPGSSSVSACVCNMGFYLL